MKTKSKHTGRPRGSAITQEEALEMHREYMAGVPLNEIARKRGRGAGQNLRDLFVRRGMKLKPMNPRCDPTTGRFLPAKPPTWAEAKRMIKAHGRFGTPPALALHWRHWTMEERGRAIAYMRERYPDRCPLPKGPFSRGVRPFDYTTPEAWKIVHAANKGLDSRGWTMKIDVKSQGVIWDGRLWFLGGKGANNGAYCEGRAWTPERGRPLLNRAVWERIHGKPVPRGHVVRHRDGNENNFSAGNLVLATREQLLRENQSAANLRRSRAIASRLLERSQEREKQNQPRRRKQSHGPDTITTLRSRAA